VIVTRTKIVQVASVTQSPKRAIHRTEVIVTPTTNVSVESVKRALVLNLLVLCVVKMRTVQAKNVSTMFVLSLTEANVTRMKIV
jgi:hypothetical protein